MGIIEIIVISFGLSVDSFTVAICKGLSMNKMNYKTSIIIGLYFGIFQAIMPLIGYTLGSMFASTISSVDHWVAFVLLLIIGCSMIKETFSNEEEVSNGDISFKTMCLLGIATSIDALAVGITFSLFKVNILLSISLIGIIAFAMSVLGVKIGNKFGNKYEKSSKVFGGILLIILGTKILLEHLNII